MTPDPDTFFLRSAINRYRLHQRAIPRKSGHYYVEREVPENTALRVERAYVCL